MLIYLVDYSNDFQFLAFAEITKLFIPTIPLISCFFSPLKFRAFVASFYSGKIPLISCIFPSQIPLICFAFFITLNFRLFLAFFIPLKFNSFRTKKCMGFEGILLSCHFKFRCFLAIFPLIPRLGLAFQGSIRDSFVNNKLYVFADPKIQKYSSTFNFSSLKFNDAWE